MRRPSLALASLAVAWLALGAVLATAADAGTPSPAATLTILAPPVHHIPARGEAPRPARPGMNLHEGDRVATGADGIALVTFLDGSTVAVQPRSEVTVREVALAGDRSHIALLIHAGRVWARVARLIGQPTTVALESNEYAATAHDGLIGAEQGADGTFVCWTRRGQLTLAERGGRALALVQPGHKATAGRGRTPLTETFRANASALEVISSPGVLPLLQMPDGRRLAGFTAPGVEVNHVFGSLTEARADGHVIEVPAGLPGPYRLVLTGLADGPFSLAIVGTHAGAPVYRRYVTGTIRRGRQLVSTIEQQLAPGDADPRTARTTDAEISRLRPGRVETPTASAAGTR
jgi:hypothetical protein